MVHFKDAKLFNLESTLTHDTNIFQQPDFLLNYNLQQPFWSNYLEYRPVAYFKIITLAGDGKRDCHIFGCYKTCSCHDTILVSASARAVAIVSTLKTHFEES